MHFFCWCFGRLCTFIRRPQYGHWINRSGSLRCCSFSDGGHSTCPGFQVAGASGEIQPDMSISSLTNGATSTTPRLPSTLESTTSARDLMTGMARMAQASRPAPLARTGWKREARPTIDFAKTTGLSTVLLAYKDLLSVRAIRWMRASVSTAEALPSSLDAVSGGFHPHLAHPLSSARVLPHTAHRKSSYP